jgi:hypothetical protein
METTAGKFHPEEKNCHMDVHYKMHYAQPISQRDAQLFIRSMGSKEIVPGRNVVCKTQLGF